METKAGFQSRKNTPMHLKAALNSSDIFSINYAVCGGYTVDANAVMLTRRMLRVFLENKNRFRLFLLAKLSGLS